MRRRAEEVSYDPNCVDFLTIPYDQYILKGARTKPHSGNVRINVTEASAEVPVRGREFVPRRIYTKVADYEKHGFTEGCKGCVWIQNRVGPRVGHSACRGRIEEHIAEDQGDERAQKANTNLGHFSA